ncbi:MAG: 6-carboxytetrahydropterin synthase [Magnetococcales bacterium]|nr:6-carboxytetrahydropterin synthase [Magnetococcales bacterium]
MTDSLVAVVSSRFEAARQLLHCPEHSRLRRWHGHGFVIRVCTAMPSDPESFPGLDVVRLKRLLDAVVAPLDYQSLNDLMDHPSDDHLARWIGDRLDGSTTQWVGLQSTPTRGVDLDHQRQSHPWRRYHFDSAHRLPQVPADHPCGRMHGHGFDVIVHARGELPEVNHDRLDALWGPIHVELHHACLNDIPGLENPTSEMLARWIWLRLQPLLPSLTWITILETPSSGTRFDGEQYHIWKEFSLDSAVRLDRASADDRRRRIHGHTFTLRLHLSAPLDPVMGWTVDFGDIKKVFSPVFARLDHHPLYHLPDLEHSDCVGIARWIKVHTFPLLPQLRRIDLYEGPGCGVMLHCCDSHSVRHVLP